MKENKVTNKILNIKINDLYSIDLDSLGCHTLKYADPKLKGPKTLGYFSCMENALKQATRHATVERLEASTTILDYLKALETSHNDFIQWLENNSRKEG